MQHSFIFVYTEYSLSIASLEIYHLLVPLYTKQQWPLTTIILMLARCYLQRVDTDRK